MGLLPIMEKGKPVACHMDWPLFYMNDFSRLGLVVTGLGEALIVLKSRGYTVHVDDRGALLAIDSRDQLLGVCDLLAAHRVECEMSDLVSCAYQG
jgi:hypothetical protein